MSLSLPSQLHSWLALLLLWPALALRAHTPSETYLTLFVTPTNVVGQWDVATRDLEQALSLASGLQALGGPDAAQRLEALALDTLARLGLSADGTPLVLRATDYFPVTLKGAAYLRVQFHASGLRAAPGRFEIDARALFGIDVSMHGFLRVEHGGRTESVAFNSNHPKHTFDLTGSTGRWSQAFTFVREGAWHIWSGADHLLFLIALLLPAVLQRDEDKWRGVIRFRSAFIHVLKIVTAFTLAHSVTLSLAVSGLVRLPERMIESLIAASVVLAAGNNLWMWFRGKTWWAAFVFGLVHGLGVASVLLEFGLHKGSLALALVGFNVGVELGQLAVVAVLLPLMFAPRHSEFYRMGVLRYASSAVGLIALAWVFERLLGLRLVPL